MEENEKNIFWFFLFTALAFATKIYAALLFSPAWLIILIAQKKLKPFIFNKYFIAGIISSLILGVGPLFLREIDAPGYLQELLFKDAGRLFKVVENHHEPMTFYLDNFLLTRYAWWFLPLIAGLVMTFLIKKSREKKLLEIFSGLILSYFIIISFSATKLEWYDMPLYPCFAVVAAYPVYRLLRKYIPENYRYSGVKVVLAGLCIFVFPYMMMVRKSQENQLNGFEKMNEASERFLSSRIHQGKNLDGVKAYHCGFPGAMLFYKYKLAEKGQRLQIIRDGMFDPGDHVLVSDDSLMRVLSSRYTYTRLDAFDNAVLIGITADKSFLPGKNP